METSVLKTIRSMLDMDPDEEVYNNDILIHINSAIMTLIQLGVGPKDGFVVSSAADTWNEFLGNSKLLEGAKQYIYIKTRLGFDPPTSSFVVEAMKASATELESRLNMQVDPGEEADQNE